MSYNNIYSIVDFPNDKELYGNFEGNNPKSAANKAFSYLIKFIDKNYDNQGKFLVFVIRNMSTNKEYKYIGNRIKLQNPIRVNKNGRSFVYEYKNVIGKYKKELDKIKYSYVKSV